MTLKNIANSLKFAVREITEKPLRYLEDQINTKIKDQKISPIVHQTWTDKYFGRTHFNSLTNFRSLNPDLTFKETFLRAHSLTPGTKLSYDYATNANFYFYIYKFFLGFSYTPGTARLITASVGLLVFLISIIIFKKFIGKNYIPLSLLLASNYYLIIQSQEYKYK